MDAIVAGTAHGMRTEGAALGMRTTKGSENNVEVRGVTGIAMQNPHSFTGDMHGRAASGATMTSRVNTMSKFGRTTGHLHVGTSADMKPKATMERKLDGFTERGNARAIARRIKISRESGCSNRHRRNGVIQGKSRSIDVGGVGRRSRSKNRERFIIRQGRIRAVGKRMEEVNSQTRRREAATRVTRELSVEITHFGGDIHDIRVTWCIVFGGDVRIINGSNTRWWTRERSVASIFQMFESSGAGHTIGRKAKQMPTALNTMGGSITDTADVGRM
jgi:hypothetical protein